MAYRELTMVEVKEVPRQWLAGVDRADREVHEVCGSRWDWEINIEGFPAAVFYIPDDTPLIEGRKTQVKIGAIESWFATTLRPAWSRACEASTTSTCSSATDAPLNA
jgi:hypothetical protein